MSIVQISRELFEKKILLSVHDDVAGLFGIAKCEVLILSVNKAQFNAILKLAILHLDTLQLNAVY